MSLSATIAAGISAICCTLALAADPVEPQPFAPDAFAQPIAAVSQPASTAATSAAPLRWKSKQPGSSQVIVDNSPISQPTAARGWNRTRVDGQVRQAQAIASDPFTDPFGDRGAVRQAADIELEPTDAESNKAAASAANGVEELPPPAARPLRPIAAPRAEVAGPEFIVQPTPGAGSLAPMSPAPAAGQACDRVYNDRNCCDLEASCKAFRNQLISDSIRHISLDITPKFDPNLSAEDDLSSREDRLNSQDLIRSWHNHLGEVVATGRMSDMANGRIVVVDESGKEVARIPWQDLGDDELCWVNAHWRLPIECAIGRRALAARNWLPSTYYFHASALCHKPLYFEEVQLERYGHTAGPFRQPFISGAHFFLNIAALPYNMGINPPHECQYSLGYYRPGSCAPWMIQPLPLSLRGAAAEVTAVLGGVYLIP